MKCGKKLLSQTTTAALTLALYATNGRATMNPPLRCRDRVIHECKHMMLLQDSSYHVISPSEKDWGRSNLRTRFLKIVQTPDEDSNYKYYVCTSFCRHAESSYSSKRHFLHWTLFGEIKNPGGFWHCRRRSRVLRRAAWHSPERKKHLNRSSYIVENVVPTVR